MMQAAAAVIQAAAAAAALAAAESDDGDGDDGRSLPRPGGSNAAGRPDYEQKGRFRLLKTPVLYHKKEDVDNIFFTCCALHNQLHQWDHRDEWENGMEWGTADGLFEEDTEPNYGTPMIRDVRERARPLRRAAADEDFSAVGTLHFGNATVALLGTPPVAAGAMDFNALVELHTENEGSGFAELQAKLVKNYAVELKIGVRVWMRSGTNPGESSSSSSRNAEKVSDWH